MTTITGTHRNRMLVSVLVPAFNEERTIVQVLRRVLALGSFVHEVIVVDDGSKDNTAALVRGLALSEPRIRFIHLPENAGKTAAIQRAVLEATGDAIIVQDADLECSPEEIPRVLAPILAGDADVVYGSRFLVRTSARVQYFYHFLANAFLTLLSNLLTNRNMTDVETCYKAFRADVIKPLRLTSTRFGMEIEITAMVSKTRARMYEVPISYNGRSYEEGKKIGWRDGVMAVFYVFRYNLVTPYSMSGRRYIFEVNERLAASGRWQNSVAMEDARKSTVVLGW